jgi:glycosyltransferase involved in cell wall biosynthesis
MGLSQNPITIVIPFYNEPENARSVLAVIKEISSRNTKWILVNNGSTDGATLLENNIPENVIILSLPQNLGFGGGIKAGLKIADTSFIAWMPGNMKVHPFAPRVMLDRFLMIKTEKQSDVFIKALRVGRGIIPQIKTSASALLVSFVAAKKFTDIGGTPTIIDRKYVDLLDDTPDDYSFELAAYYKLITAGCTEVRIASVYLSRIFGNSHWQFGTGAELRLLNTQIHFILKSRNMTKTKAK